MAEDASIDDPLATFRLDGMLALVTGAGSGIGRAASRALAAVGASVVCADVNADAAGVVATEIHAVGGMARAIPLDVRDENAVEACFANVGDDEPLAVLVNSAGISRRKPAFDLSREDWDAVNDVNVTGSFLCARAAARQMRRGGSIINIASVLGLSGGIYPNVSYMASKGAVISLTRALAAEWARRSIRVNGVAPGWIDTPFMTNASNNPEVRDAIEGAVLLGRIGHVKEVVGAILYLASPASSYVTGHTLVVDGGFLAR